MFQYRMRHCGLRRCVYLVEDFGSMQHFSIPEDTLSQAIINTQVSVTQVSVTRVSVTQVSVTQVSVTLVYSRIAVL